MEAWESIRTTAATYGADETAIEALAKKITNPYRISDGNAVEHAATP